MKPSAKHHSDFPQINKFILDIATDGPKKDQAILTLREMIKDGKSELIFNTILDSSQL